eukprot:COSAG05_NODE_16489_length_345_cov_0.626016_1_plen_83_part_10
MSWLFGSSGSGGGEPKGLTPEEVLAATADVPDETQRHVLTAKLHHQERLKSWVAAERDAAMLSEADDVADVEGRVTDAYARGE